MAGTATTIPRIKSQPAFAGILRDEHQFVVRDSEKSSGRYNGWFDRLLIQSGVEASPAAAMMLCFISAIALGGLAWVLQENFLTAALGAVAGAALPVVVLMIVRSRRQKKMLNQLPGMIGELARAARTGRSLEQCLEVVAEDTPAPLGDEMKLCSRKMQMGVGPDAALRELPERTGLTSLYVLVTALSVHHRSGGDLVRVLERLSHTIRDRINFLGRVRAATSASRATAILMVALPPVILAFLMFRDPNYLSNLMSTTWGFRLTIAALVLQVIGSVVVLRILKSSRRT